MMHRAFVHTLRLLLVLAMLSAAMILAAVPASACDYGPRCLLPPVADVPIVQAATMAQIEAGLCETNNEV